MGQLGLGAQDPSPHTNFKLLPASLVGSGACTRVFLNGPREIRVETSLPLLFSLPNLGILLCLFIFNVFLLEFYLTIAINQE